MKATDQYAAVMKKGCVETATPRGESGVHSHYRGSNPPQKGHGVIRESWEDEEDD